jgi:hypothetical protein
MNNELYHNYEGILKKTASRISKNYHIEYDECFSEACLILVKSFYSFDPEKSCFITHLSHNLMELYNFARKEYPCESIPENFDIPYHQRFLSESDEYNFSGLEKEIVNYAEKNYYIAEKKTKKTISGADIYRQFKQAGYRHSQIKHSIKTIKEALQ